MILTKPVEVRCFKEVGVEEEGEGGESEAVGRGVRLFFEDIL